MIDYFPGGVWPVMLTPFTENNEVDYVGLAALTEWYISQGKWFIYSYAVQRNVFVT